MAVITGHGGYVPVYRIDRTEIASQTGGDAMGTSAVAGPDEDHVTMAAEASETALQRADIDGGDLDAVFTASVTDRFAEHGIAPHVAYRFGATGDVRTADFSGSARAATDALALAATAVEDEDGTALVVGVDRMLVEPEHDEEATSGACAGAVIMTTAGAEPVATVEQVGQATTGFVERHREHGGAATQGDLRFAAEFGVEPAVTEARERATGDTPTSVTALTVNAATERLARRALSAFDGDAEYHSTRDKVGHSGPASFFLDLVFLLEGTEAGETVAAVNYGAGGADVVLFETGPGISADEGLSVDVLLEAAESITYAEHLKFRPTANGAFQP